jgi:hypothetical protein
MEGRVNVEDELDPVSPNSVRRLATIGWPDENLCGLTKAAPPAPALTQDTEATLLGSTDEATMRWFILVVALLLDPAAVALLLAATRPSVMGARSTPTR